MGGSVRFLAAATAAAFFLIGCRSQPRISWMEGSVSRMDTEMVAKYGAALEKFVRTNFAGDQAAVDTLFSRCERIFEQFDGHMNEIQVAFRRQTDLDLGPVPPYEETLDGTQRPLDYPQVRCR